MASRNSLGQFNKTGSGGGITWASDTLTPGIATFPPKLDAAIGATMRYYEPKVESYARSHAPWRDRTSNARTGLAAKAYSIPLRRHGIVLFHRVNYGIYLEVRHSGKYRIIVPTILSQGQAVMNTLVKIMRRIS